VASITVAAKLGARLYTVHPGFLGDPTSASGSPTNYDFVFGVDEARAENYEKAFERFVAGARILADHARSLGVRVAVESEGSVSKRRHLLLQAPEEFARFFAALPDPVVGINLNIGHLNLAANAFGFDRFSFIDRIAHRVMAIEISHNEGAEDEHRPPVAGAWYWPIVGDPRFARVPIILECRDTPIEVVCESVSRLKAAHIASSTAEQVR
jgi:sugar phosphate isomerase/epimerase